MPEANVETWPERACEECGERFESNPEWERQNPDARKLCEPCDREDEEAHWQAQRAMHGEFES